jgi:hypothetical protein
MSQHIFDVGDYQRLEREARLTQQLPRQPLEPDRSPPVEEPVYDNEQNIFYDDLIEGMLQALERRLSEL